MIASVRVNRWFIAIYTNASGCGGSFTRVACNDNINGSNPRAVLTNTFAAGISYYIVVGDPSGEDLIPGETQDPHCSRIQAVLVIGLGRLDVSGLPVPTELLLTLRPIRK